MQACPLQTLSHFQARNGGAAIGTLAAISGCEATIARAMVVPWEWPMYAKVLALLAVST